MPPDIASMLTSAQTRARAIGRVALWVVVAATLLPGLPEEWPAFAIAMVGALGFGATLLTVPTRSPEMLGGIFSSALAIGVVAWTGGIDSPYAVLFLVILVDDAVAHQLRRLLVDGGLVGGAWLLIAVFEGSPGASGDLRDVVVRGAGWLLVLGMAYQVTGQLRMVAAQLRDSNREVARNEQRFRSLFDNHPDGVHIRDREGRLVAANPAVRQLVGLDEGDPGDANSLMQGLVPPSERDRYERRLQAALDGVALSFRSRLRRLDGTEFPVLRTYIPITEEGGTVGVFAVSQDITGQVEGERATARLASIVEHADVAIMSLNVDMVTSWNRASERLFGWTAQEMFGRSVRLLVPEDRQHETDEFDRRVRRGEATSIDTQRLRKDGSLIDVNVTVSPVRGRDGRVVAASAIVLDISARKQAERALRASEERFRLLADQAEGLVYRLRLEPELQFEYVNAAARTITGYSPDAFYANPELVVERTHPEDRPRLRMRREGGDAAGSVTFRFQRRDGSCTWLEDHYRVTGNGHGGARALQGMVFDVAAREEATRRLERALEREQAAAEQLRRTSDLQTAFLRAVSHELRTPLTSILGFAHTLNKHHDSLSPHQSRRLLERLVGGADRLRGLLDDLLDLNRLSQQTIAIDPKPTSLAALCQESLEAFDPGSRDMVTDLDPVVLPVDARIVGRIVDNLLRNAVRHTPPRTTIRLLVRATADGGILVVEDDGPGVPDDLKQAIFDPFRQGPKAVKAARPGTGIGLHLVRMFTELHDGRAWVEDRPGGGARFVVFFPAAGPSTA